MCNLISIGIAIAPVACNRIIFDTPFRKGLNWFMSRSSEDPTLAQGIVLRGWWGKE